MYRVEFARARRAGVLSAGVLAAGAAVAASPAAAVLPVVTATTSFTSAGQYTFTVPVGVTSLDVTAVGAAGGACGPSGGRGASVAASVTVVPGEQLAVGVGAAGSNGCSPSFAAGGAGGGASGGVPNGGAGNGAGGGGASVVSGPLISPGFTSYLVVAGGGGGAGAGTAGGDAGSPGANASSGATGGGAGTSGGGGTGGTPCSIGSAGSNGTAGVGGAGGNGPLTGGGGGGGGYFGGGGGGGASGVCSISSGGGGGGSSFVAQGSLTAPPTSDPAGVSITYDAPTADESASAITFAGTQPQGVAGSEQVLTLTNNGNAPLVVSGYALTGANRGDFQISDRCQSPVVVAASCEIGVRFAPQAQGASTATLSLSTNAPTAPAPVTLSGTGGTLPQGPQGIQGAQGPQGAAGPAGPAGQIRLVTCTKTAKKVHGKRKIVTTCRTRLITGTATFRTARAVLLRDGRVAATGTVTSDRVVLHSAHALRPGRYTLRLTSGSRTIKETITIR
jgi:hypothetical protein